MFYSPNYFCETIPQGQSRPRLAMKRAKSLAERDPSQSDLPRHSQQPSEPNNGAFGPTSHLPGPISQLQTPVAVSEFEAAAP